MRMLRKRRAVFSWSLFLKWAIVAAALGGVYAVGIYLLWGVVREPLFLKWAAVPAALGVYAVGTYLLWGVVRELLFRECVAVAVGLGVYAGGTYLLWRFVPGPLFLKWALVLVALFGVYAVGIYLLWRAVRDPLFLKWAAVAVALGVFAVGILLLWGVWDGAPVAAAFTRVGGATRVETSLGASRFWLTPPQYVVKTRTDSSQIMLGAAQCAIDHDAPLLFTSQDLKRKRRVNAIINDWRNVRKQERARKRGKVARLNVIHIKSQSDVTDCTGKTHRAYVDRLSTLEVLQLPQLRPQVRVRPTLARVVVFAAAIKPGHLPDVAIGLALAAHMARENREKVSLVVVPNYLESDLELEHKLESQHELVTGGVVLGQTPTVPEDTRALLRQLLTSRDRHGVLGQLQDNLGSLGPLIAALLALGGLAAATRITALIVIEPLERKEQIRRDDRQLGRGPAQMATIISNRAKKTSTFIQKLPGRKHTTTVENESDWLAGLPDMQEVTVWLRSGRQVTGTIEGQIPTKVRDATVFRIKKTVSSPGAEPSPDAASPGAGPSRDASPPRPEEKYAYVLVSVKEIEQIHFNDPNSGGANANQTSP